MESSTSDSPKPFPCEFCDRSYELRTSLNRHYRMLHKIRYYAMGGKAKCPFPSCSYSCKRRKDLRIHLNNPETHNIGFKCYKRKFNSMADFLEWKAAEEEKTNTFFTKTNKTRPYNGTLPVYYRCNRSGFYKMKQNLTGKAVNRKTKTKKINATCPAAMNIRVSEGKVSLVYHKTHVGHGDEMEYQRLSKDEKDYIAGKLYQGYSFEKIIEDIQNDESLAGKRIRLATKVDVHNVMRSYRVEWSKEKLFSDLKNTDNWVRQLQDYSFSPVLFYKPRGMNDRHANLYKRDFMLSIMTEGQKQMFGMLPKSVVGFNCSFESNSHRFFLLTVSIFDESGSPFPIAYCVTNRTDATGMKAFLNSVKKEVGKISAPLLVSDNSQACTKAWDEIMGLAGKNFLYFPFVKHQWRKNLQKALNNSEKEQTVYNLLETLSKEPDTTQFEVLLKSFVEQVQRDDSLKEFGSYFESNFLHKTDMWALCYCFNAGLPTVTHMEKMHDSLHDVCFYEGIPKSVDLSIRELLLLAHKKYYKQLNKKYRDSDYLSHAITQSHGSSEQIKSTDIECVEVSVKWKIKPPDDDSVYSVQKQDIQYPERGQLYCPLCQVYLDAYSCNCVDYLIMCTICEHVHAVAHLSEKQEVCYEEIENAILHLPEANYEVVCSEEVVDFTGILVEGGELTSSGEANFAVPVLLDNSNITIMEQCDDTGQNITQYVYILQE